MDAARAKHSRWRLAWAAVRYASPLTAAGAALLVGVGIGAWLALSGRPAPPQRAGVMAKSAPGAEIGLRLEREISLRGR